MYNWHTPRLHDKLYIDELVDMLRNSGCPGVFINEEVPSLHILMFADDVTLLNDTIDRKGSNTTKCTTVI